MAILMEMPKLSDTMKEGVLRKWRKQEGDTVAPGDIVAEVETDKATMDYEAFDGGVLLKRLIGDGDTVPVGAPIGVLGKAGEDIGDTLRQAAARKGGTAAAAPAPAAAPPSTPAPPAPAPASAARAPATSAATAPTPAAGAKILASPLARRLAADLGVDLRSVSGSGPGGRIVERDVKAAAAGGSPGAGAGPGAAPSHAPPDVAWPAPPASATRPATGAPLLPDRRQETRPPAWVAPGGDQTIPLSLMRKTIARRLVESKSQIPHFYLTADADAAPALAFRAEVKEIHGAKLSLNDLVIKASALALRRVPECNASFADTGIVRYARVDIGMAVAIDDGLLTPVLRNADVKTLGQISVEAQDLAKRARERKLKPEDMTGATFSISNLGMMGIREFCAIINPPEAAILAVGTARKEPVVRDDQIVVGTRMSLTLSCDHRVIDGALGAKLLGTIISILERPMTLAF